VAKYDSALAASPLISIVVIFIGGNLLNRLGFYPEPSLVLIICALAVFFLLGRQRTLNWSEILRSWRELLSSSLPAICVGTFVWLKTFDSIPFIAPNQDGFHHNLWIRRAMELNSFRAQDLKVDSPLAPAGMGSGIYPLGWHTSIGSWAPLSSVSPPTFALLTVAVLWVMFLPFGVSVAMKRWLRDSSLPVVPATIAATTFVQVIPILPGIPLSWGSMTSIIGISFLPCVLAEITHVNERRSFSHVLFLGLLLLGLLVVHPPEAATALIFLGVFFITNIRSFSPRTIGILIGSGVTIAGLAGYTYRGFLTSGIDHVRQYWGAVFPDPTWALGSFFSLSIRTPGTGMAIAILFIAGIIIAARQVRSSAPLVGLFACLGPYLLSGGSAEPLATLRILSMPWYASYERTLWITVPFAAIFAGIAVSKVWSLFDQKLFGRIMSRVAAILLFFLFLNHQLPQTIQQMREGVVQSMVVFDNDEEVYRVARRYLEDGKVILALGQDGGSYGYMVEGLPISFLEPLDRSGKADDHIATLQRNWKEICALEDDVFDGINLRVSGLLVSERSVPWGAPGTSRFEIENLKGLEIHAAGDSVYYLEFEREKCG